MVRKTLSYSYCLANIRGEHTFAETADMSIVFGFAYGSVVAARPSYQDAFHTRRVPDKEKSVTSIGFGGERGDMCRHSSWALKGRDH